MKLWIHEDIFKTWTDAQKRLWESLCSAIPLQPPTGVESWRETYLKNLASWEAAIQRSLEQEAAWVEEWVRRIAQEKGTPEVMASWARQMEEVLQRWIQTQNQWWSDYFAILRGGGFAPSASAGSSAPTDATETAPSESFVAVEPPPVTPAPPAAPEPMPVAEAPVTEAPVIQPAAPVPESPDDLKLINGIGPALEKKLNACGVASFRELATLSDADIQRIETFIKFTGRIRREDWIGQAKAHYLHKYGQSL
ncbi:MAG: hypothetical protein P9F19_18970 [Candidatus Contendobacter sp.]|nr:hypothetical protein [Candidatus Contendobacter sp.]MDG4559452.1 hypothetical protein [Candidatus Contendobacter sp.]